VPFSLKFFLLGVQKHNNFYLRLAIPSSGRWSPIVSEYFSTPHSFTKRKSKPKTKESSYEQLANMSVEQQIKNKLQQEKITCFFNQLTGKKY